MKRKLLFMGALFFAGIAGAQVSTEISNDDFRLILADTGIEQNWNAVQALQQKAEIKSEDQYAVYQGYLTALYESALNSNTSAAAIIQKEITAVEQKMIKKK